MFGKADDRVKDHALRTILSKPFEGLSSPEISLLFLEGFETSNRNGKFSKKGTI